MTIRTTVAFDPATVARWERLAKRWGTSKSEALRRALEKAETQSSEPSPPSATPTRGQIEHLTPHEALAWLQSHPLVTPEEGHRWRESVRQTREDFAGR